jgi:hypothetical protein
MTTLRDFAVATTICFGIGLWLWPATFDAILARTDVAQVAVAYQPMRPLVSQLPGETP